MSYIFLINTESKETEYFALPKNALKQMPLSETYDDYGQVVGSDNAGDHLVVKSKKAVKIINAKMKDLGENKRYKVGDVISDYDDSDAFMVAKYLGSRNVDLIYTMCKAYNYWDGHNWASIVVESDIDGYYEWELVEDSQLEKSLNHAVKSKKFVRNNAGITFYETSKYIIEDSAWQGTWESYKIIPKK